jgi:hypothetical protein
VKITKLATWLSAPALLVAAVVVFNPQANAAQLQVAQDKNCFSNPSACGFPDATNTGYEHTGVKLTTDDVSYDSDGNFRVNQPGAVIEGKDIRGCVMVFAPNVTIRKSKISCAVQHPYNIRLFPKASNFTLEDVEVDGSGPRNNAAFVDDGAGPVTMRRVDMHDVADGPHPGTDWLIEDSYIHDLTRCDVCHNDTIQSAGAKNVTLRHNTLVNLAGTFGDDGGMNAVVRIATEQGTVNGFVVENNLLVGGNFAVQTRSQGNGAPVGVRIINNRIGRGFTPDNQPYPRWEKSQGAFDNDNVPDVVYEGNVWDDDNTPVND